MPDRNSNLARKKRLQQRRQTREFVAGEFSIGLHFQPALLVAGGSHQCDARVCPTDVRGQKWLSRKTCRRIKMADRCIHCAPAQAE
jgi:hypothetical protein